VHLNMFTKISKLINRDLVVTQEFIDYRNRHWSQGGYESEKNCDYLFLEWWLVHNGYAAAPENWRQDFIWKEIEHYVDCKRMNSVNFNVKDKSLVNLKESFSRGKLTHFLFYNTIDGPEILKTGDIVSHTLIAYEEAGSVFDKLRPSQYDGQYYRVA